MEFWTKPKENSKEKERFKFQIDEDNEASSDENQTGDILRESLRT